MRQKREIILWVLVALTSALLIAWAFPRALPWLDQDWQITGGEAEAIALERLRDLGEPVDDPYIVSTFTTGMALERRLHLMTGELELDALRGSHLARSLVAWNIEIFARGALAHEWSYRCRLTRDGEVIGLLKRFADEETTAELDESAARERATEMLRTEGWKLEDFADSTIRREDDGKRKTTSVRFPMREAVLGEDYPYGMEVRFAGDQLAGFLFWFEDPHEDNLQSFFRQSSFIGISRTFLIYLLLPFVVVPFLRRYHDGQLGVRRGVQLFSLFWLTGAVYLLLNGRDVSSSASFSFMTRHQTTWLVGLWALIFMLSGYAVLALMSWAVGESFCRQLWPQKLASLDALFRLKWSNSTVARASLRGLAGGLAMAALILLVCLPLQNVGAWPYSAQIFDEGLSSALPGLSAVTSSLSFLLPVYFLACLLIPCWAHQRFGSARGLVISLALATLILQPVLLPLPLQWGLLAWAGVAAIPVLLFRFGDLLSALLAGLTAPVILWTIPLLKAEDPSLQANGYGALLVVALPFILSLRHLGTHSEFHYSYDDIPPHVRRIAERERQRVELETAARIQSSILPQLPPQLNGVEVAHTYLPASEVGGDFYDVLALEDGRVAVAVGDVAGHGVSSGLVMSMAKSALAVQVTFDPQVESVFKTLNRMVFQSARQRLLTTLCYAVIDPQRRELFYASAGHLFPYRVSSQGQVEALEAASYPLGVRDQIDIHPRTLRLEQGDSLFMYSDGLVEAHAEHSDEPFGFDRLESSLEHHAGKSPGKLRDAVLADVEAFTGNNRNDDDLTVLILRLPAAA